MSFASTAKEIGQRLVKTPAGRCCAFALMGAGMATFSGCAGGWEARTYSGAPPEIVGTRYINYDGTRCTTTVDIDGYLYCADNRHEDRWGRDPYDYGDYREDHDGRGYKRYQKAPRSDDRRQDPPKEWKQDGAQKPPMRDRVPPEGGQRPDGGQPSQNSHQEWKQDGTQKPQKHDRVPHEGVQRPDWKQLDQPPYPYPAPDGTGRRR